jgi:hypothetical protein
VPDSADLLRRFQELVTCRGSVRLINAYRGVPVAHPATVLAVHQGSVVMDVHPHQAACMLLEGKTHLLGEKFPQALRAGVVSVDILQSQALLAEFCQAQASIGKRLKVRVQPAEPMGALIFDGKQRIPCQITDISERGAGIAVLKSLASGAVQLSKSQRLFLELKLPGCISLLQLQAKITSLLVEKDTQLQRIGLITFPDQPTQLLLQEYIAVRQAETLEEVQRVHQYLCLKQGMARG